MGPQEPRKAPQRERPPQPIDREGHEGQPIMADGQLGTFDSQAKEPNPEGSALISNPELVRTWR